MRRPLIAITGELLLEKTPTVTLATRYAEAVRRAGGTPFVPAPLDVDHATELLDTIDGLVVSGGDDFDTEPLGQGPVHPAAKPVAPGKQAFDLAMVRGALARGLPTLGICYGMQLLGLTGGARLLQHLPEDRPGSREHSGGAVHTVRAAPGTKLAELLGIDDVSVISRHHQGLATPGEGFRVAAQDDEGLIEAIEAQADEGFALGVQWHPELALDTPAEDVQAELFRALVGAAASRVAREVAHA